MFFILICNDCDQTNLVQIKKLNKNKILVGNKQLLARKFLNIFPAVLLNKKIITDALNLFFLTVQILISNIEFFGEHRIKQILSG